MTLTIDGYVVELKVRESWQNRNSKEAALNFYQSSFNCFCGGG